MLNCSIKSSEEGVIEQARNFISSGKELVCAYGRLALRKEHIQFLVVDISASGLINSCYQDLKSFFKIQTNRNDSRGEALVIIDKTSPFNHQEGYQRTWELYRRIQVANSLLQTDRPADKESIEEFELQASSQTISAQPFENANYFFRYALPRIGAKEYLLTAMGPTYQQDHPRYAPISMYVLVRKSDFEAVLKCDPSGVEAIREVVRSRIPMSYNGLLPYVFPEDPACLPAQSKLYIAAAAYNSGAQTILERALRDESLPRIDREQIQQALASIGTRNGSGL